MPAYKDEKRGTWYASFYYTDWTGTRKLKKKRGFKKQSEAKEYEREFLALNKGSVVQNDILFKTLVEEYMDDARTRLKRTSMATKEHLIEHKLLPYLGNLKICDITPATIRKWQNVMLSNKNNYSQTYLKTIHNQLSAILNYAVKFHGLPSNPCHITGSIGKKTADSMQIWIKDEYEQFISYVTAPAAKIAFEILFWTGIREGELLALTPGDFHKNKILDISKTYTRLDGEDIVTEPKTQKSKRSILIPDFLYDEIQDYINKLYSIKDNERIFYFTKGYLLKHLESAASKAGVKRIRIHDLRHSHASLLIDMGYSIFAISERLGHEKVETTMNIYGHLYPNKRDELVNDLQKLRENDNDKKENSPEP